MKRRDWLAISVPWAVLGLPGCAGTVGAVGAGKVDWERVDAAARRHGGRGWAAWEGGRRRAAWQAGAGGPILSITKALAGLACARALGEGWLRVDEAVGATIDEWRGDPGRADIRVRHLLQMTAGLSGGARVLYRARPTDKGRVAARIPLVELPGTRFRYGPACWELLAELVRRKLAGRGEDADGFMRRAVLKPVGLRPSDWREDGAGRRYWSTGAELSVNELGQLGRVVGELAAGRDAAGIRAADFAAVTRPSRVNPHFGGGVWRNGRGGREVEIEEVLDPPKGRDFWAGVCLSRSQPASLLVLVGSAGRRVFIWPESGRVVARLGVAASWRDRPFLAAL